MQTLRHTDSNFKKAISQLDRHYQPTAKVRDTVAEILASVSKQGDRAVACYTQKFGGPTLSPARFRVSEKEIQSALSSLEPKVRRALLAAKSNVAAFAQKSLRRNWKMKNRQGAIVGERFDPFQRVGLYVPGGTAPLVSTAVMTCTLAQAAKVPEIVAVTPADSKGRVHPALLSALHLCGATEVYRIGGAQAIAAIALGTKIIAPVDKIFGPGNAYVVEAKRQVFGRVAVDLLPGPSEILIIADSGANPAWIAADLLAQAEHGHGSIAILVSNAASLLAKVEKEVLRQSATLKRQDALRASLRHTFLVHVKTLKDAVDLANDFAPEHLSLAVRNPQKIAQDIRTSGAIFFGDISPVAGGDFVAGPSHELPTGGAGKSFAGLTVDQFQRRTSLVEFNPQSLRRSLSAIRLFSEIEGLDAHGRSAAIRLE
ncbi:MAG: histidinol dehydrogenase [Chthoniobacterales bacterium]